MTLTKTEYGAAYSTGFRTTVRFLASRGVPPAEAADVAQGAWAKGWEKRHSLRNPAKIVAWINSIAINLFRKQCRDSQRLEGLPEFELAAPSDPVTIRMDVRRGLQRCSRKERRMMSDYLAGYTSHEIGRRWNVKATAVRVRLHRAKQKLRNYTSCANAQTA